jgi:hypothetical protein
MNRNLSNYVEESHEHINNNKQMVAEERYKKGIAHQINLNQLNMINHLAQPVMMGGKIPRDHPLPYNTDYTYPATLLVDHNPRDAMFKLNNMNRDLENLALEGSGVRRRGRPRMSGGKKESFMQGFDKGFNKALKEGENIGNAVAPIAEMAGGRKRGRPRMSGGKKETFNHGFVRGLGDSLVLGERVLKAGAPYVRLIGGKKNPVLKGFNKALKITENIGNALVPIAEIAGGRRRRRTRGGAMLSSTTETARVGKMSYPKALMKVLEGPKIRGAGVKNGRAVLVKKLMNEKGMKLGEASKYIKDNNLY